jgi:hypothetical protein
MPHRKLVNLSFAFHLFGCILLVMFRPILPEAPCLPFKMHSVPFCAVVLLS